MKIIKNEQKIRRNAQIGSWTSLAAMAILGLGMYISFTRTDLIVYSLVALIAGLFLTFAGNSLTILEPLPTSLRQLMSAEAAAGATAVDEALLARGVAYQLEAPTLWDVDFKTAVAQAELEDREQPGAYHRLRGL